MTRRRILLAVLLVGAAIAGGVLAIVLRGGAPAPVIPALPPVTTATVMRTDLSTTVLTEGTLGYAPSDPVVNRFAGTYTELPPPGTPIAFGQVLYRVDNAPVVLMEGATPAWRPFSTGMTDGPDVTELQAGLVALGDTSGLFSHPSGDFDSATVDAVERWQRAEWSAGKRHHRLGADHLPASACPRGRTHLRPGTSCLSRGLPLYRDHHDAGVERAAQSQPAHCECW